MQSDGGQPINVAIGISLTANTLLWIGLVVTRLADFHSAFFAAIVLSIALPTLLAVCGRWAPAIGDFVLSRYWLAIYAFSILLLLVGGALRLWEHVST